MQFESLADGIRFVAFLEEALTYVDQWTPTQINAGGCGHFAALLCDHLTPLGFQPKIIAIYTSDESKESEDALKNYITNGRDLSQAGGDHIIIQLEDLYLDSTGLINPGVLHVEERVEITREQLEQIILHGQWNPTFDRGTVPFIASKLEEVFAHIDDFHTGMFKPPRDGEVDYSPYTRHQLEDSSIFPTFNDFMRIIR